PGGLEEVRLRTEDGAVLVHGDAYGRVVLAGVLAAQQVLAPVLDPLHRSAEPAGSERDRKLLGAGPHLLSEGATDVGHDDSDPAVVDPHDPRQQPAHAVRPLRRDPY